MNIHIVEDDPVLARTLQINLELEGYKIFLSTNVDDALKLQKQHSIQFVILDLGLPGKSGFEFLTTIRAEKNFVPIIILSAQSDEDSVVKGLQLGANDFVKKPYSFKELHARMKVNTKSHIQSIESKKSGFSYADITVDSEKRVIHHSGGMLELNRREFDIFSHLVQRAEMIISRDSLIQILDKENEIFDRTIDSHVSHIRKSLKSHNINSIKISSVYGLGYRLEKNDQK